MRLSRLWCWWAHPRPCGEHGVAGPGEVHAWGSSPPVRGAPPDKHASATLTGLIPARAGSTETSKLVRLLTRAHPRPCGEHLAHRSRRLCPWGSSPPVRGAPDSRPLAPPSGGLIPARAGSTMNLRVSSTVTRAHPRPCGEHAEHAGRESSGKGSSPPVRGAPGMCRLMMKQRGLIPARAGSTPTARRGLFGRRAHPRPCGEHMWDMMTN